MAILLEDEFCYVIMKARYGLGLSADDVAQATGISSGRLAELETEGSRPTREECATLSTALQLQPWALWQIAGGWAPTDVVGPDGMRVQAVVFPEMSSNGYVISSPGSNEAYIVDPGGEPDQLLRLCEGLDVKAILLTHSHHDHVAALPQIVGAYDRATVVVHKNGLKALPPHIAAKTVSDDTSFDFGPVRLQAWLAPGHSDDGLIYVWGGIAFTGDTLFAGSLGRSAAGPATYDTLLRSARRLLTLPEETVLFPGHGPATTVGTEKKHNAFIGEAKAMDDVI